MSNPFSFVENDNGEFQVMSRAGYKLSCQLDLPSTKRHTSAPQLAVLCHGLYQDKNSGTIVAAMEALLKDPSTVDGVVRFDFHGEGKSEGRELWSLGGYVDEMEDLRDVIEVLRSNGCNIGVILGHSRGATVVELYASTYGDVPLVVPIACRLEMETGIVQHVDPEMMQKINAGQRVTIIDAKGNQRKVMRGMCTALGK